MSMTGDYMSMAEACGEAPPRGLDFTPGVDFDPYDEDDVAAVKGAMELNMGDRMRHLEEENAQLRAQLYDRDDS